MQVVIDIEMPKSCHECPLSYLDTGDDAWFGGNDTRCVIDDSNVNMQTDERLDDCPLREVNADED